MRPVLLATDGSPTAAKATDTAIELAQLLGTDLVVVTVWNIPYPATGLAPAPVSADYTKISEDEARKLVAAVAAMAEDVGVETHTLVRRGFPVEEICLLAEKYDPRFLVVGSHGWGAVKRALFGSVSTGVLHHAECPVLVVRGESQEGASLDEAREHAHA